MTSKTVTWRPSAETRAWLEGRAERSVKPTGLSARTATEIGLWQAALNAELKSYEWSLGELRVIAEANNSVQLNDAITFAGVPSVAWNVMDFDRRASRSPLYVPISAELITRLRQLGPTASYALSDAVCRWWNTGAEHSVEGWASVGVLATDSDTDEQLSVSDETGGGE